MQAWLIRTKSEQQGFTLIEVMIVVAILGILTTIGAPLWQETSRNLRLKSDAQTLLGTLQWAKGEAARRNACIGLTFNTVAFPAVGGGYTVFVDDGAGGAGQCNRLLDAGETTLSTYTLASDVSLVSAVIGGGNSLCFTANSVSCGSQQGNVQLRNTGRWYQTRISAAGGLRLLRSSDGNNWL